MENFTIQPLEVVKAIKENLKALRKDCEQDYEKLTEAEREELRIEFEELEELALSIKKDIQADSDSAK